MTTFKKMISALAVSAAGVSASVTGFAQTAPVNPALETSSGLLGQRYAEYGFGFIDVHHSSTDAFAAGLTINLPVAASFDVSLNYTYGWAEGDWHTHSHDVSATGLYYFNAGPLKPFVGLSLGYDWNKFDDAANWGATVGVEYQINPQVVLTASVGYDDDFKSGDNSSFDGTVRANYWFTRTVSAFGSFSLIEAGDRGFAIGVTLKY